MKKNICAGALLGLAALLASVPGAGAQDKDAREDTARRPQAVTDAKGNQVQFEVVKQGNNAFGHKAPGERLITNEAEWAEVWKALESTVIPTPPVQPVDFSKVTLIAVFAGEKRTGGYSIAVKSVRQEGKTLEVEIEEKSPGKDTFTTMAFTSPYQVVSVPRGEYELKVRRK